MRSASIGEWMIGRFIAKKRAASIVGDLVELKPKKGALWFWFSLAVVMVSVSWRKIAAVIAALYAFGWSLTRFVTAIFGINAQHRPDGYPWAQALTSALIWIGAMMWGVFVYLAIRYGPRDRVAQLAGAWTALITATIFYWWQPVVMSVCLAVSLCVISFSIAKTENRRSTLVLIVTLMVGFVSYMVAAYLGSRYQRFVYSGPWGDKEVREHPSVSWVIFGFLLLMAWVTTTACSRMHAWKERGTSLDLEGEVL